MRRFKGFSIQKESFSDMHTAGRFNPCLEIVFRDRIGLHVHKIAAGYSDDIHVYRENGRIFVLSKNDRLGYIGLEVFGSRETTGEVFVESHDVESHVGRYDLAPFTIIRRLEDYVS